MPALKTFGTVAKKYAWMTLLLLGLFANLPEVSAQPGQPTRVRIGLAGRNFSFLPFFVAEQQKFLEQEGIRTEMIYMRSPVAIPALSAGEIQYTTHFASVVRSAVKGFPVRVILSTSDRQMFSLVAAKSIKRIEDLKGKRISSEMVNFTQRYFAERKIPVTVEFSWGATEAKAAEGLVDAIVEVTETGSTIRAHGLKIIHELMESCPLLIANKQAWQDPWKRRKIEQIKLLLLGALSAENKVGIKLNVAEGDLEKVVAALRDLD